jgi:hypothetical protein
MRRVGLVLTAALAFAVTTVVMRSCRDDAGVRSSRVDAPSVAAPSAMPQRAANAGASRAPNPRPRIMVPTHTIEADPAAEVANHTLRNAIDEATLEDMFHREARIEDCLDPAVRVRAEKLRFSADVVASEERATVSAWRLVEAAEGEALTEEAIQCAERARGGDLVVTAPDGETFPTYAGPFSFTYRIPAPSPPG